MTRNPATSLSQFIKRIKDEKNLSLKGIEAASELKVGDEIQKISGNYVNDLIQENADPTVKKVQALARGIGESEDLVFEYARGVAQHSTGVHRCSRTCIAKQISELPAEDQKELRPLLDMVQQKLSALQAAARKRR